MPVLSDPIITELLGSIEADRLMLLCGAGLSLPSPSNLLPAWRVAEICYEKRRDIEDLPAEEVALQLDCSKATVRSHIANARVKFRRYMARRDS